MGATSRTSETETAADSERILICAVLRNESNPSGKALVTPLSITILTNESSTHEDQKQYHPNGQPASVEHGPSFDLQVGASHCLV